MKNGGGGNVGGGRAGGSNGAAGNGGYGYGGVGTSSGAYGNGPGGVGTSGAGTQGSNSTGGRGGNAPYGSVTSALTGGAAPTSGNKAATPSAAPGFGGNWSDGANLAGFVGADSYTSAMRGSPEKGGIRTLSDGLISSALAQAGFGYGERARQVGIVDGMATSRFGANLLGVGEGLLSGVVPGLGLGLTLGDLAQKAATDGLNTNDKGQLVGALSGLLGPAGALVNIAGRGIVGDTRGAQVSAGAFTGGVLGNQLSPGWGGMIGSRLGGLLAGSFTGQTPSESGQVVAASGGNWREGRDESAPASKRLTQALIDTSIPDVGRSGFSFF